MRCSLKTWLGALGLFVTLAGTTPAPAQEQTLYQRLGGYDAIAAVVGEFADRLFQDPKLERFFGAMTPESQLRFKQLNVELVCKVTGGPCEYIGLGMAEAHQGMAISGADFDQVGGHLAATLDKFNVPAREKDELLTIVGSLRPEIVTAE